MSTATVRKTLLLSIAFAVGASSALAIEGYDFDVSDELGFYDCYDGTYGETGDEDDWFYDSYELNDACFDQREEGALTDDVQDYENDVDWFEWQEDGLFE